MKIDDGIIYADNDFVFELAKSVYVPGMDFKDFNEMIRDKMRVFVKDKNAKCIFLYENPIEKSFVKLSIDKPVK